MLRLPIQSTTLDGRQRRVPRTLRWLVGGFAIDVRSLAAFRIAMAALVLLDLADRARDLTEHYTDWGVFPRATRIDMEHNLHHYSGTWGWSLHLATGTTWGQALLFLLAAFFAVWMLIGYRTRLATAVSWLLFASLVYRNPLVEDAGDVIMRTVLFWSMFLPLGATASVDRLLRRDVPAAPRSFVSIAGAALLLQICMIYWATAAEKYSPVWTSDYTALYYTLSIDAFATPFGHRFLAYPQLLRYLTAAIYWLEWIGPLVAISPLARTWPRLIVVLAICGFHLGTAFTMELGLLPWICIAIWTVFLPSAVWDWLGRRWHSVGNGLCGVPWRDRRHRAALRGTPQREFPTEAAQVEPGRWTRYFHRPESPYKPAGKVASAIVAALLLYVAVWNFNQVSERLNGLLPPAWKVPAHVLALQQTWRMFAPFPLVDDGWYEMRGVLADGSVVNLWDLGQSLPRRRPENVAASYHNRRWRKYLLELRRSWTPYIPQLADWLRRRWNEGPGSEASDRWVKHIEVIYHIEMTLSPERTSTLTVPEIVFEGDFSAPMVTNAEMGR
jgi:hypothetical protein